MYKLNGRLLVHETGAPLSNLVVAAFDVEAREEEDYRNLSTMNRLGSAATDSHGEFNIEFTGAETGETNSEDRPDLIVAVFPPIIVGIDQRWDEPLYVTPKIRSDSGHEEAFVIYLPEMLLRERGVPPFAVGAIEISSPELVGNIADVIKSRLDERKQLAESLQTALRPELERRRAIRKTILPHIHRLMGSAPARLADRFVVPNSDPTPILEAARNAGMQRLTEVKPRGLTIRKELVTHVTQLT